MQASVENVSFLAILGLGGWEVVLILAIILMLFGARLLPAIARGLAAGIRNFDEAAKEAGESVGGIHGRPATEALTPDNQTAELYDPAVFRREEGRKQTNVSWLRQLWKRVSRFAGKTRELVRAYLPRLRH